jgi:hypothetical protein
VRLSHVSEVLPPVRPRRYVPPCFGAANAGMPATDSAPAAAAVLSAVRLEMFKVIVSSSRYAMSLASSWIYRCTVS